MGVHFIKGSILFDGTIDPEEPEALIYEVKGNRARLVGVEFIVIAAEWHANNAAPPVIMGQQTHLVGGPEPLRARPVLRAARLGLPPERQGHVRRLEPGRVVRRLRARRHAPADRHPPARPAVGRASSATEDTPVNVPARVVDTQTLTARREGHRRPARRFHLRRRARHLERDDRSPAGGHRALRRRRRRGRRRSASPASAGLEISIRGGGHNIAGTSVCDGGVMIDLSQMRQVRVDAAARRAYVEPGALLADVDRATLAHGLATPLGINSTTGVAGLTLGGGFGWLTRTHGLTVDNLVSADVVGADGTMRRASADREPRPVLGAPRRRRQLRRRHRVRVRAAPDPGRRCWPACSCSRWRTAARSCGGTGPSSSGRPSR